MDLVTLSKNIATIASMAVPVLGNVLSVAQVIEGLVGQFTREQLPTKPDGTPYAQADVVLAALAAHRAWHAAD